MKEIKELRVTVSKIESLMLDKLLFGLTFHVVLLTKRSEQVVTDRLIVSDEGVRVLNLRE
jgi:hypothetical protein